jgi:L-rhamnose isomerase
MTEEQRIEAAYKQAADLYAGFGVDTDKALATLTGIPLSLHCWQGDDVRGFEHHADAASGGGIQVTGSHPGRARTPDELRADLMQAYRLIPGRHRLNLHAMYGEFGGKPVDRDRIEVAHFQRWMDWAGEQHLGLDFNASCFAHPRADTGYTLSSTDKGTREFWIEHVRRCRVIAAAMGKAQGSSSIHNLWIPDGAKDITVRRYRHRTLLKESLDTIYATAFEGRFLKDAVESKLFGIGSEAFVVGSHEFYLGYALDRKLMLCLDMGHFHPTESVADKIPAVLQFAGELLLHVSRGVRWDSDHVVIVNDDLLSLAQEIVRADAVHRVHVALDFFDGSMNRLGAWVLGARSTLLALLRALLEPRLRLETLEEEGNFFGRLALLEETKHLPLGAVWEYHCLRSAVPTGITWMDAVQTYERTVLGSRP